MTAPYSPHEELGHARRHLEAALARDRLPHGLLFLGEAETNREEVALELACALLCTTPRPRALTSCGCAVCRRVLAWNHPDVHLVAPEAELVRRGLSSPDGSRKPSRDIRVDQVRELAREMRLMPYEGKSRIAIVIDAHRMTTAAANALLKTLEEPGPSSVLVLLAPHERALLPTIASRAARLRFPPTTAGQQAAVSDGASVGSEEGPADDGASRLLAALVEPSPSARLRVIEDMGRDRDEALAALDGLSSHLVERLRRGARAVDGAEARSRVTGVAALDDVAVLRWLDAVLHARRAITANAHVQIALEELLLLEGR